MVCLQCNGAPSSGGKYVWRAPESWFGLEKTQRIHQVMTGSDKKYRHISRLNMLFWNFPKAPSAEKQFCTQCRSRLDNEECRFSPMSEFYLSAFLRLLQEEEELWGVGVNKPHSGHFILYDYYPRGQTPPSRLREVWSLGGTAKAAIFALG